VNARRLYRRFLRMPILVSGRWYARIDFEPLALTSPAWRELDWRLNELDLATKYAHLERLNPSGYVRQIAIAIRHSGGRRCTSGLAAPRTRVEQGSSRAAVTQIARLVAFLRRRGARPVLTLEA